MNDESTTPGKSDHLGMPPDDWRRLDTMTDEEITAAALSDPDNPPLTAEQLARMRRPALVKRVRHKLHMSRATFAAAYDIPLDTLTAWERHEAEPTPAETAYLKLIARQPDIAKITAADEAAE